MTDLSKLSDADLTALQSGDLSKVSDVGLTHLSGAPVIKQADAPQDSGSALGNLLYGVTKGAADFVQAPAQTILNLADKINQVVPGYKPNGAGSAFLHKKTDQFNQHLKSQEEQYQAETPGSIAAGIGRVGVGTLPFLASGGSSGAPQAVGAIPKAIALAKSLAAGGGVSMLTQPVNSVQDNDDGSNSFLSDKAKQGAIGVAGTGVGKIIGNVAGRLINPALSSEVMSLIAQKIKPTIGQMLGGGWAAMENKSTIIPILGDMIKNAQRGTVEDYNRAAYARALTPLGVSAENLPAGHEGVLAVKNALTNAYDTVLPKLHFKADQQFSGELDNLTNAVNNGNLPPNIADQFNNIVKNEVTSRMTKGGTMDGIQFKELQSKLTPMIKGFNGSLDQNQKTLGSALGEVMTSLRSSLTRSNPEHAPELNAINEGFANYARIRAAAKSGDANGIFTPAQLSNAIKAQDETAGKGAFATGQALMQDLSKAGRNVMPTYPDSGTAGRNALLMLPGMAASAAYAPFSTAATTVAGLAATLPYTDAGKRMAVALLAKRPAGAAQLSNSVRQTAPALGAALAPALSPQLLQMMGQ